MMNLLLTLKHEDIIAWGVQGMYIDRNQYR